MTSDAIVLIHGGLYDDMDAHRFWAEPGVTAGLTDAGFEVHALQRPVGPASWAEEADVLAAYLRSAGLQDVPVVAGSNGCSSAVRLAIDHPELVSRLVLCWPATASDEHVDRCTRQTVERRADEAVADRLLAGKTLRGVTDMELQRITLPVAIVPAEPDNAAHQRATVDKLKTLIPHAVVTKGLPESPHPDFHQVRTRFINTLIGLLTR